MAVEKFRSVYVGFVIMSCSSHLGLDAGISSWSLLIFLSVFNVPNRANLLQGT